MPTSIGRPGPSTILTEKEEELLEEYCLRMCQIGYGKSKRQILDHVKEILDDPSDIRTKPVPFKNNRPGNKWFQCFLKRHPRCSLRYGEMIGKDRAQVTPKRIDKWFEDYKTYIDQVDQTLLKTPSRIFNADEAGFALQGKSERILAPRGMKNVYQVKNGDKTQITVLAAISASGAYVPPLIIAPGCRLRYDLTDGAPEGTCLGKSPSGWINAEIFYEWVANHFHQYLIANHIPKPVLLLIDGHTAHINIHTAEFCHTHNIILYCLPPSASHILQPCDVGLFASMKTAWTQSVADFQASNIGEFVTKQNFGRVFKETWGRCSQQSTAVNSFRSTGLYPFNPMAYDQAKVRPSSIYAPRSLVELPASSSHDSSDEVDMEISDEEVDSPTDEAAVPLNDTAALPDQTERNEVQGTQAAVRRAIEATLSEDKLCTFRKRLDEGYDIQTDPIYNAWKSVQAVGPSDNSDQVELSQVSPDVSSIGSTSNYSQHFVSPAFAKHLRYPSPIHRKRPLSDRQKKKMQLPHAVSGDKYRQFLREAHERKEEEARLKEEREKVRVEKRREKEEEAERKKREHERKRVNREKKKQEAERKKLEAERRRVGAVRKQQELERKKLEAERKKHEAERKKIEEGKKQQVSVDSISEEKLWVFRRRLEEGYNIKTDPVYNAWKAAQERKASDMEIKKHEAERKKLESERASMEVVRQKQQEAEKEKNASEQTTNSEVERMRRKRKASCDSSRNNGFYYY